MAGKKRNRWAIFVACVIGLGALAEASVRMLGMVDFPLYHADSTIGYIPAPSQSGSFLDKNEWRFNSLSMGAPEFAPTDKDDILLIGDSIVLGGNPITESERLGPRLQASLAAGTAVWPISAGSWSLRNELIWMRQHPEVLAKVEQIVLLTNSGDFVEASEWSCDLTHPREKPAIALLYLARKYTSLGKCDQPTPPSLKVPPGDMNEEFKAFIAAYGSKTLVVFYPDVNEAGNPKEAVDHFAEGKAMMLAAGAKIEEVEGDSRWKTSYYRDPIHPSAEGYAVLGPIIADRIVRHWPALAK